MTSFKDATEITQLNKLKNDNIINVCHSGTQPSNMGIVIPQLINEKKEPKKRTLITILYRVTLWILLGYCVVASTYLLNAIPSCDCSNDSLSNDSSSNDPLPNAYKSAKNANDLTVDPTTSPTDLLPTMYPTQSPFTASTVIPSVHSTNIPISSTATTSQQTSHLTSQPLHTTPHPTFDCAFLKFNVSNTHLSPSNPDFDVIVNQIEDTWFSEMDDVTVNYRSYWKSNDDHSFIFHRNTPTNQWILEFNTKTYYPMMFITNSSVYQPEHDVLTWYDNVYNGKWILEPQCYDSTFSPTITPTFSPSVIPTNVPTYNPSDSPTLISTVLPTISPTLLPSTSPSFLPSVEPTIEPTHRPSAQPTYIPTLSPTIQTGAIVQMQYVISHTKVTIGTCCSWVEPSINYRVAITPRYTDSDILITYNFGWNGVGIDVNTLVSWAAVKSVDGGTFYRSTLSSSGVPSGARNAISGIVARRNNGYDSNDMNFCHWTSYDHPGTTKEIIYGLNMYQESAGSGNIVIGQSSANIGTWGWTQPVTIIAMEIRN